MNLLEFAASGGHVSIAGQLLEISPRQLRYLFAIGAFKAGKAAASSEKYSASVWGRKAQTRLAAKQAMQKQIKNVRDAVRGEVAHRNLAGRPDRLAILRSLRHRGRDYATRDSNSRANASMKYDKAMKKMSAPGYKQDPAGAAATYRFIRQHMKHEK